MDVALLLAKSHLLSNKYLIIGNILSCHQIQILKCSCESLMSLVPAASWSRGRDILCDSSCEDKDFL